MNLRFVTRVRILSLCFLVIAIAIIGRLYMLQIVRGETYAAKADAQFVEPSNPFAGRNSIFFTDKNGNKIVAATVKVGYALSVNPTKVVDPEALYEELKDITPLSRSAFVQKVSNKKTQYVRVAEHLDDAQGIKLQKKKLPGLIVEEDRWRFYPGGSLAAQTLGFVAYRGDVQEGRYGLERYYEQTLVKDSKEGLYSNFFVELFGGVQELFSGVPKSGDLITTIEPSVEAELERTLAAYNTRWNPKLSGGIIMDPKTGEILAMAVNPTFNLNEFGAQKSPSIFANPLVENVYEMGSIMKPLTVAAGIDSGVITALSTYNDTGKIVVDGKTISNFDGIARGVVPVQEILSQSLNVGASYVATKMGPEVMREYFLKRFKFGEETGIDLPGEVHGLVENLTKSSRLVEFDTASFGQGLAITPIATIRALASLANGGFLVTPHLVRAVQYDTGLTEEKAWNHDERILRQQTTTEVSRMLTEVVDKAMLQGALKIPSHSVAAKTGTAQIANPAGGGYYQDRFLHSFFGYFPSYDAKFVVFLFALEPKGATYASQTLAEPFRSLTEFLINYYAIPPDR